MTVYQTRRLRPRFHAAGRISPGAGRAGTATLLFASTHASRATWSNPQQDKGYIGPPLTQVGSRLTAAWIYHWLKNPQALRPGTIEPNQDMSDEDARALTAFLMTQKASGKTGGEEMKRKLCFLGMRLHCGYVRDASIGPLPLPRFMPRPRFSSGGVERRGATGHARRHASSAAGSAGQ